MQDQIKRNQLTDISQEEAVKLVTEGKAVLMPEKPIDGQKLLQQIDEILAGPPHVKVVAKRKGIPYEIKISPEDTELVSRYSWYLDGYGYAYANKTHIGWKERKGVILMHRLILDSKKGQEIDHINRDKADNRRENLRVVSHQINMLNKKRGIGVTFDKKRNLWRPRIKYMGKEIYLGRFGNREEALNVRRQATKKYFGEFADV